MLRSDGRMTVVVATYNRRDEMLRTLERLTRLPERPHVIVVDNGSADGTADAVVKHFPDVGVIRLPNNIGAAARNHGIVKADTPYVALCDDDTWWAPGSLRRAADILDAHSRMAVVTARVVVEPRGTEDPICRRMAESPLPPAGSLPGRPIMGFLAGASMVRRGAVLEVGAFEPRFFLGGEEGLVAIDLATKGWALAYLPDITVYHAPSPNRDIRRRRRDLIRNGLWLAWLRRPVRIGIKVTWEAVWSAAFDPALVSGIASAVRGLPWVLRHRRTVPANIEAVLVALERQRRSS
jgi:GT2 family glycosyltransferase